MAIIAGIDEAGLGPLLGPLVVSGTAFRVPDDAIDTCLWKSLGAAYSKRASKTARKLVVADSKKLYKSGQPITLLERSLLVTLAAAGRSPQSLRGLLNIVAPGAAEVLDRAPWYARRDLDLPRAGDLGDIPTRANAVARAMGEKRIELLGVYANPLTEYDFNDLVDRTRNKSAVLMSTVFRVLGRILHKTGSERARIYIDRLGGRTRYREPLMTAMPDYKLRIVEESETRSAYELTGRERTLDIEFVVGGDGRHFPIALASMFSKYIRELYMTLLNEYWCKRQTELKPTAGYYNDAVRWLEDAEPAIRKAGVDRSLLVRSR